MTYQSVTTQNDLSELFGQGQTCQHYYGETTESESDPETKVVTGQVPLRIVLSLFLDRVFGGATNEDTLALVDLMTPGLDLRWGLTNSVIKHVFDVCVPELRMQLPEIAAMPLPDDGNLRTFYQGMVRLFGETVKVTSIPKQFSIER